MIMVNRRWAIHYKERQTCCLRQKCRGQLKIERYYTKKTEGRRIRWDFHAQSHARIGVSSFVDGDEWMLGPHRHTYTVRLQTIEGMRGMRAHMVLMSEFIQNGSVIICDSKIVFSHWIVYFYYVAAPSMQLLALNYNPHESFSFIWGPVLFFPRPLRTCSVQRSTIEKQSLCCSLPFWLCLIDDWKIHSCVWMPTRSNIKKKGARMLPGVEDFIQFFQSWSNLPFQSQKILSGDIQAR